MLSIGQQAADFIKVLRPALNAANMSNIGITCCESEGWGTQATLTNWSPQAGNTNEKLIQVDNTTNTVVASKRVRAFAQFSWYIRSGASGWGLLVGGLVRVRI
jgi:hypothetical protein